jgi:uncharacterized protein (DUF2126 family)
MSGALSEFKPSEDEFREIWRLRHDVEEPYGGTLAATQAENYKADPQKDTAIDAKLKEQLGDDRYQAYKKATDTQYQMLAQIRDRFGLNQDTVNQAYDLLRQNPDIMAPAGPRVVVKDGQTIQTDPPVEPSESLAKLKQLLGDKGYSIATANTPWSADNGNAARGAIIRNTLTPTSATTPNPNP